MELHELLGKVVTGMGAAANGPFICLPLCLGQ